MTALLIFAALLPLGCILYAIGRSVYGTLCPVELPGFLFILLAGAEYRRAVKGILERRAKKVTTPIADFYRQQGKREGELIVARIQRSLCLSCGTPHPLASGRCGPCYERHHNRRH